MVKKSKRQRISEWKQKWVPKIKKGLQHTKTGLVKTGRAIQKGTKKAEKYRQQLGVEYAKFQKKARKFEGEYPALFSGAENVVWGGLGEPQQRRKKRKGKRK